MLQGIDGKILHLKELDFIERMLYQEVLSPDDFYKALKKFLEEDFNWENKQLFSTGELKRVDDFINNYFAGRIEEAKIWLLRAYVVGRYLAETDIVFSTVFEIGQLNKLPKFVLDAAKRYGLTIEEAEALRMAVEDGAALMSNTTASTVQTVRSAIVESVKQGKGSTGVFERLKELTSKEVGELNRDWMRVAITETNAAFNNGYLAMMKAGDYVVGMSMPDACEFCSTEINGRGFKVRSGPPKDYSTLNPESDEYRKIAEIWENEVWVGKNNYGRSTSRRKRINPLLGNAKLNLREKEHHEHSMAAIPAHPWCRCRYVRINPLAQWIDGDGQIRLRVEDEDEWERWYKGNINQ